MLPDQQYSSDYRETLLPVRVLTVSYAPPRTGGG